jgi:hypothetical protein
MMHGYEKSDSVIVAVKPANKAAPCCGAIRGGVSRSGVGGAKDGDQGECGPAKHGTRNVSTILRQSGFAFRLESFGGWSVD